MEYLVTLEIGIKIPSVDDYLNSLAADSNVSSQCKNEGYLDYVERALLSHRLVRKVITMQQIRETKHLYVYEVVVRTKPIPNPEDFGSSLEQKLNDAWDGIGSVSVHNKFAQISKDAYFSPENAGKVILCRMKLKCEENWASMARTNNKSVRFCSVCSTEVHRVNTAKRLKQAIDNNWCIYYEQQAMEHKTIGMPSGKSEQIAKILDL